MDWTKILTAVFLVAMMIYIFPRMRQAMQHAPKGESKDWMTFLGLIVIVALFVFLLIQMV
jgi:hypothetical protein